MKQEKRNREVPCVKYNNFNYLFYFCSDKIKEGCDDMNEELILDLITKAKNIANQNFCCKYSNFTVGAALLCQDGSIYTGFNIENDGIQSICAERSTFAKALTDGKNSFTAIAVVARNLNVSNFSKTLPCGYCRQFLSEYTKPDFKIYTYDDIEGKLYSYTIAELLPESFRL